MIKDNYEVIIEVKRFDISDGKWDSYINKIVIPLRRFNPTRYLKFLAHIRSENPLETAPTEVHSVLRDRTTSSEEPLTKHILKTLMEEL